jgi:diguanylate cyclase (GGDEF)-like protein
MKILVIDDDDGDIRMVALALKQACPGYALSSAETLAEGVDRLCQDDFDLVLLDMGLPDSHGLKTVDRVCKSFTDIPIIVLTGLDSEETGLEAIRRGASDYLVKGQFSAELLSRTIRYSLERKRLEQRLVYLAGHDPLTGALNRRSFEKAVNRAVAQARRERRSVLLLIDVDRFKLVNDTLGHSVGDDVLVNLADRIREELREEDVLGRVGGDEFAVLLEGVSLQEAQAAARRIRLSVENWIHRADLGVRPTLSIGLVGIDGKLEYEALISLADKCLYQAKSQGRNRVVCVYSGQQEQSQVN